MRHGIQLMAVLIFNLCLNTSIGQVSSYQKEIDNWHQKRLEDLKSPNGWVNLAGLFWLKEGKNSFGSAATNDIVFNHPAMPAIAGYFEMKNQVVSWTTNSGVKVSIKDSLISNAVIFQPGSFRAPLLALNNFRWNIIQRDNKIGVRFRDLESAAVKKFTTIERFPVDSNWRVAARLETAVNSTISITNVLGQTNNQPTPGKLVFTIGNTTYHLDALEETPGELPIWPSRLRTIPRANCSSFLVMLPVAKKLTPPAVFCMPINPNRAALLIWILIKPIIHLVHFLFLQPAHYHLNKTYYRLPSGPARKILVNKKLAGAACNA